ncbi:MAG: hypothetical protein IT379_31925 [Deltaproteobacteria bacterium]|nr:hypothetical protein [Deltaproteobacteria bacterium]
MPDGDDSPKRRVLYAFLRATTRFAEKLSVPARQVQEWVRLAYFQELRASGMTVAEACARLGLSAPTGARLSRALKTDFLAEQVEHDLPKRIAFTLWAGPMSRARLAQVLPRTDAEAIDVALATLVREGRVVERKGRTITFEITRAEDRLVRPGWGARLTALTSLLDHVVDTVHARFFESSPSEPPTPHTRSTLVGRQDSPAAFARTVSFRMRREDRAELRRFYEEKLWPFLKGLEERAATRGARDSTRLSILWVSDPEDPRPRDG